MVIDSYDVRIRTVSVVVEGQCLLYYEIIDNTNLSSKCVKIVERRIEELNRLK